jgi:gliding motility-associated-like protein
LLKIRFKYLVVIFFLLGVGIVHAQLVVNHQDVNFLVQKVLLCDNIKVSNVVINANTNMLGYFNGTKSNVGLKEGLILSTGNVSHAIGPNNEAGDPIDVPPDQKKGYGLPGDPDLEKLSPPTMDAAVLEFDFVPLADSISIKYVFASEEYLEYVNKGVNDVFGFFLSGPGISGPYSRGAVNIALTPGTSTPVSVNTINKNKNSNLYIDNGTGLPGTAQYNNNKVVQYDGLTRPLVARYPVTPGLTYHIKLAIADVGDGIFDSAVFLEANSFFSKNFNTHQIVTYESLYEGCDSAVVSLKMTPSKFKVGKIPVRLLGTAQNGIDYKKLPDSVMVNPINGTVSFNIVPLKDNVSDDNEFVDIVLISSPCNTDTIHFSIKDLMPIVATSYDTVYCGQRINITAKYKGGADATLAWLINGSDQKTISVNPGWNTTDYFYTVNDHCKQGPVQAKVRAVVNNKKPKAGPDQRYCSGPDVVVGEAPNAGFLYSWNPTAGLSNALVSQPTVSLTNSSGTKSVVNYIVKADNGMCQAYDTVVVSVLPNPLANIDPLKMVACPIFYVIPKENSLVADSVEYFWSSSTGQKKTGKNAILSFPTQGFYSLYLTVTNYGMCSSQDSASQNIEILTPPIADFTLSDTVVNMITPSVSITGSAQLADTCFSDVLSPTGVLLFASPSCDYTFDIPTAGNNKVVQYVIAKNGCRDTLEKSIYVKPEYFVYAPNAFTINGDGLNEEFKVYYSWAITDFDFTVYDRWGHEMYHQVGDGREVSWDGRALDGSMQPIGVYVYKYTYSRPLRGKMVEPVAGYGHITLLR